MSSSSYTPTITLKTKRQEAKAAAEAAAAAAADACAVCGLLYGDDAEKDDLWVACDRCNKWYHGLCVDQTQVRPLLCCAAHVFNTACLSSQGTHNEHKTCALNLCQGQAYLGKHCLHEN